MSTLVSLGERGGEGEPYNIEVIRPMTRRVVNTMRKLSHDTKIDMTTMHGMPIEHIMTFNVQNKPTTRDWVTWFQ
mgnify:CR=1 FL=1